MVEGKYLKGKLSIIATPIGNLEDITLRAMRTLKDADIIACEDTRRTSILCSKYDIKKPLVSYHSYSKLKKTEHLIEQLQAGKNIGLVSDAGTPGISDPGFLIIKKAIEANILIESIPGPSAIIASLAISGKPTNKFIFEGFLSNKSSQRRKRLEFLRQEKRTVVLYESPHRIVKLLQDILDIYGDIEIACARELTKKFEDVKREKVSNIVQHFTENKPKGEFTVII